LSSLYQLAPKEGITNDGAEKAADGMDHAESAVGDFVAIRGLNAGKII
jgi:hypothetical protein